MVFTISGHDVLRYVAYKGISFKRNDIDGANAGRTQDGIMHRDRVGTKLTISVTCRTLTTLEARDLLKLIDDEYFMVKITHPLHGDMTMKMYTNNVPIDLIALTHDGYGKWGGIKFNLIEV